MALPKPVFVDVDPNTIVNQMVAYYEAQSGKKLQPADVERLILGAFAYREAVLRNAINDAAVSNLVEFAPAPVLDYLAAIVGVVRIPAVPAECQMSLSFIGNSTDIVIPEGMRIAAQDQKVFFRTIVATEVPADTPSVTVTVVCETEGEEGNGYVPGEVNVIMDPQPYLELASNTDTTAGGAADETDDQLRERIKLAPGAFSNAGSVEAYKFFARSAHPSIVDVAVPKIPLSPGTVNIYPLIESGEVTPIEILELVEDATNADTVRPLTDTVVVASPTRIEYALDVRLILFEEAIQADVIAQVQSQVDTFINEKRKKLGRDIKATQLYSAIMEGLQDSIYDVVLFGFADIAVEFNEFAFCTGSTVIVTGTDPG